MSGRFEPRATWVVVIGETCEDFCFALACDRLFLGATWLPPRLIRDPILAGGLLALRALIENNATYAHQTFFTLLSLDDTDVEQSRLTALAMDRDAADRCSRVVLAGSLEFGRPKRLADPGSLHLGETSTCYPDEDGSLNIATALSTPIPDVARSAQPSDAAWEIDVSIEREQPLPRSALGPDDLLAASLPSPDVDVRAGTASLTYHSERVCELVSPTWSVQARPRALPPR